MGKAYRAWTGKPSLLLHMSWGAVLLVYFTCVCCAVNRKGHVLCVLTWVGCPVYRKGRVLCVLAWVGCPVYREGRVLCVLTSVGCPVYRDGRVLGVLEVSRSIGDGRFKRCGVSCVPDVMRCSLTDNDRYNGTLLWTSFRKQTVNVLVSQATAKAPLTRTSQLWLINSH